MGGFGRRWGLREEGRGSRGTEEEEWDGGGAAKRGWRMRGGGCGLGVWVVVIIVCGCV